MALGLALLVPSVASGQVVPPGTLPPEVDQAIADAIAQLPNPLVPAVEGVGEAAVTPGHAEASVVDIDGVVTVGKTESSKDGSKVTVLNVGGTDVLVKEGNASGGEYTGEAAAAGGAIDQVNEALCPGGPPATGEQKACVLVLYSKATTGQTTSTPGTIFGIPITTTNETNSAQFRALSIHTPAGPESLTLGSTSASTTETTVTRNSTGATLAHGCTDVATSFLVSGGGTLAALLLVNPGGPLNGVAFSIFKAC